MRMEQISLQMLTGQMSEVGQSRRLGATYYDLRIVCRSCNKKKGNCLLA